MLQYFHSLMAKSMLPVNRLRQFLVCIGIVWAILLLSMIVTMFRWGSDASQFPQLDIAKVMEELNHLHEQNLQLRKMANELRCAVHL